ncbi:Importin subunit beta-1, partial [Araneus ventricosus]
RDAAENGLSVHVSDYTVPKRELQKLVVQHCKSFLK